MKTRNAILGSVNVFWYLPYPVPCHIAKTCKLNVEQRSLQRQWGWGVSAWSYSRLLVGVRGFSFPPLPPNPKILLPLHPPVFGISVSELTSPSTCRPISSPSSILFLLQLVKGSQSSPFISNAAALSSWSFQWGRGKKIYKTGNLERPARGEAAVVDRIVC